MPLALGFVDMCIESLSNSLFPHMWKCAYDLLPYVLQGLACFFTCGEGKMLHVERG